MCVRMQRERDLFYKVDLNDSVIMAAGKCEIWGKAGRLETQGRVEIVVQKTYGDRISFF